MDGFLQASKPGLAGAVMWLLLSPATAANADSVVVQQIGELSGAIEDAVAAEVTVVPFSRDIDPRTTPIILATGKAFIRDRNNRVAGLAPAERRAIKQAYAAGWTIVLLDASSHDVEALHVLLEDGAAFESGTDSVVFAYALRQENGIPTARLVTHVRPTFRDEVEGPHFPVDDDSDGEDPADVAWQRALDIVIDELTRPPVVLDDGDPTATSTLALGATSTGDPPWSDYPVQTYTITSPAPGTWHTPVAIYALHQCADNTDWYLVDTGGDWTPEDAQFQSANTSGIGSLNLNVEGGLAVTWVRNNSAACIGGPEISGNQNICQYVNYPLSYSVDLVPQTGPTVELIDVAPTGENGSWPGSTPVSADYSSGFNHDFPSGTYIISGGGGTVTGVVTWDNTFSSTVPPLLIDAGMTGNAGSTTQYKYCVRGTTVSDCSSKVAMTNPSGDICQNYVVGGTDDLDGTLLKTNGPQEGQTSDGTLGAPSTDPPIVAQTALWQVDPATYASGATTFDITVTWSVDLATSYTYLWWGPLFLIGPSGFCNSAGCSCSINTLHQTHSTSMTFTVPLPSTNCS